MDFKQNPFGPKPSVSMPFPAFPSQLNTGPAAPSFRLNPAFGPLASPEPDMYVPQAGEMSIPGQMGPMSSARMPTLLEMAQANMGGAGTPEAQESDSGFSIDPRMLSSGLGGLAAMLDAQHYNKLANAQRQYVANQMQDARSRWNAPVHKADGGYIQTFPPGYEADPSVLGWLQKMFNDATGGNPDRYPMRRSRNVPPPVVQTNDTSPGLLEAAAQGMQRRDEQMRNYACGGLAHYVRGGTAGQDDKVPAMLSDGEYVMDADTVASLGDGNNAAGAQRLDQMRQAIRSHKRSAPASSIPPKAKNPLAYLKGAK